MNIVVVSTFRRPFHTRLCLESLARAQRWSGGWADQIAIGIPCNSGEYPAVAQEIEGVIERNPDIPFQTWLEGCESNPHAVSEWLLDYAFEVRNADIVLYVEDDVIVSPDAFVLLEWLSPWGHVHEVDPRIAGLCLYHETMPEHYIAAPPDPTKLHLCNGLNTCGGTAFLRKPYLEILSPQWNCKQVLPTGFDYSAHYLMYLHKLYMVYPDLSRSMNLGFELGSLSRDQWARYCGRSLWVQTNQALKDWRGFTLEGSYPAPVLEEWMKDELRHKGIA